jgi:hypothetical protein
MTAEEQAMAAVLIIVIVLPIFVIDVAVGILINVDVLAHEMEGRL